MDLTEPEAEELVLKRCWLSRYWGLAARHGVYADIAHAKHSLWSSLASSPMEIVISAAQKAMETPPRKADGSESSASRSRRSSSSSSSRGSQPYPLTMSQIVASEDNIESMLAVENGLREMALLRVEEAVMLTITDHRNPTKCRLGLSFEEVEDVRFKQAWLLYFWSRAKWLNQEKDIAEDRVLYWMQRRTQPPTFRDTVDVERGLLELQKLGLEKQQVKMWNFPRENLDHVAHPVIGV